MNKKLYFSFNDYLKKRFNAKVYKVCIDGKFFCPNRDGTFSKKGCIYCDAKGSSSRTNENSASIKEQVLNNIDFRRTRYKAKKFIIYFQSFSNTYADIEILKKKYDEALFVDPDILGISISTRPDCIDEEKIKLIHSYKEKFPFVNIEFGLQSIHNRTLELINRQHTFEDFLKAFELCKKYKIDQTAHVILNLPNETLEDMLETAKMLAKLNIEGVKIHQLSLLKNTYLEKYFKEKKWKPFIFEEFIETVIKFIELLPPEMIIHRFSGSGYPRDILAPIWARDPNKNKIVKIIKEELLKKKSHQGFLFRKSSF